MWGSKVMEMKVFREGRRSTAITSNALLNITRANRSQADKM